MSNIEDIARRFEIARMELAQIERELRVEFPTGFDYDYSVGHLAAVDTLLGMVGATIRSKLEKVCDGAVNLKTGEVHPW